MQRKTSFINTIQSTPNYARGFKEMHSVSVVNLSIMDMLEELLSLNLMAAKFRRTDPGYIRLGKMPIKNGCMLSFCESGQGRSRDKDSWHHAL